MPKSYEKLIQGYQRFRERYVDSDASFLAQLSDQGQRPQVMIVACSDSRADPALILQCDPGDLFVVRNVASIVPPYQKDAGYHGTSAALEFGIRFLQVTHLILLGHSQCGGMQALRDRESLIETDFIGPWVSLVNPSLIKTQSIDDYVKEALLQSYQNCLSFPWIFKNVTEGQLHLYRWFFEIKTGELSSYDSEKKDYVPLARTGAPFSLLN